MTKDEALKLALEALECTEHPQDHYEAITAIKEALAQPEPEYLAFMDTPQRTWVGLTDEEIKALASWWPSYDQMPALMVLAKDIQNSLKEKNT